MKSFINSNLLRKICIVFTALIIFNTTFTTSILAVDNVSSNASVGKDASTNSSTNMVSSTNSSIPTTYSPACILMEQDSGKILYSKNANTRMYPASTTKIMTAILTLENCKLDDVATASHNAIYSIPYGYSVATIQEGEELTIEQLLNVLLIPSANDAAVVLAEHIAGSVEAFSEMMNSKAVELGCKGTHFINPNGVHNENHYTTAYDLALMGQYAMKFTSFRSIVQKTSYKLPSTAKYDKEDRLFNTTNDLIKKNYSSSPTNYYYEYATGAKTGYTDPAQNCIVATATKNDVSLIAVVLHDERTEDGLSQRAIDCKTLFEYGFNNYSVKQIASKNSVAEEINIKNATKDTEKLELLYSEDLSGLIPNDADISTITPNIKLTDNLVAPILEGTNLGTITYNIDGFDYSCSLIASHTVNKSNIVKTLMQLALLILFLYLFAKFIRFKNRKRSKKSKSSTRSKHSKNYVNNFYPSYNRRQK